MNAVNPDLISAEGLEVWKASNIPNTFRDEKWDISLPSNWIPKKYFAEDDAMDVRQRLHDEMVRFNIIARPNMSEKFDQASPHLLGGRAYLQPGLLKSGRFYIHQFFLIAIVLDDVTDAEKGNTFASHYRVARIVSALKEEKVQLALEIANEDSFDSDIMNWWIWHFQSMIATYSDRNRNGLNHYFGSMFVRREGGQSGLFVGRHNVSLSVV